MVILLANVANAQDTTNDKLCASFARFSGFALHSRISGMPEDEIRAIANLTFPSEDFPKRLRIANIAIDRIYALPPDALKSFRPAEDLDFESLEMGAFQACIGAQIN